ncbi:hypothetical protein DMENIID0001_125920 [Sergentomyia squamirostris]
MTSSDNYLKEIENNFEKCLKDILSDEVETVISCTLNPLTEKTANCSSVLRRAEIRYLDKKQTLSSVKFILKVILPGKAGKHFEKYGIFDREIYMYETVLPQMFQYLSSIGCMNKIAPSLMKILSNPVGIVLEDLCSQNYNVLDRKVGMNLEQTLSILENIAKFHAASVKIQESNPEIMKKLQKTAASEYFSSFYTFYKVMMSGLCEEVCKWPGFEDIAHKLLKLKFNIMEKVLNIYQTPSSSCFNVLNHNDLWTTNCLFKYDEVGCLINSVLIDYQLPYWGSPAFDLNGFLFTSVDDNIRKQYWNYLIYYYHQILSGTLKDLKIKGKIPTVIEIHKEIMEKGIRAVIAACFTKALNILATSDFIQLGPILSESQEGLAQIRIIFSNPKFVEIIKPLLWEFYWMGYLD